MPTVLRLRGYRFFFYADERNEPPHIHVSNAEKDGKVWLDSMTFAYAHGYTTGQQREIVEIVIAHMDLLRSAWNEFHSGRG